MGFLCHYHAYMTLLSFHIIEKQVYRFCDFIQIKTKTKTKAGIAKKILNPRFSKFHRFSKIPRISKIPRLIKINRFFKIPWVIKLIGLVKFLSLG